MRLIAISTVAEYNGALIDVAVQDPIILGYNINQLLDQLFGGTPVREEMAREFHANLLFTADKSCGRRNSDLFRRYVNALARGPKAWFRLRNCEGLARFTIAAALACSDMDDGWLGEEQLQMLGELSLTMYDATAYYKHRAEGEVHNTFAYAGAEARVAAYHRCREVLWALDAAAAAKQPSLQCALNFTRYVGGPIRLMMRRYRFVDDALTLGNSETEQVASDACEYVKLWNRVDRCGELVDESRYAVVTSRSDELLFPGLADMLDRGAEGHCHDCTFRAVYGADTFGEFGGVKLCGACRLEWQGYLGSLAARAAEAFPCLLPFS